ncbi:hypothetical protein [Bartonella sp. B17]
MLGVTQAAVCKWEKRGSISLINYLKLQRELQQKLPQLKFVNGSPVHMKTCQQHSMLKQHNSHS